MRGQLVGGLVAVVAGVAVSVAGPGGARACLPPGPGSQLWAARYNGPGNAGVAYSVAVSPGGHRVFVTGQSESVGASSDLDYATVAYNAATGARLWVARYNGPANSYDAASSVAVSPTGGTVFVTGVSQGTASGLDYATVAYNAATGARLWVQRYNGPGNGDDGATSVAVSSSGGTVFVTGYSQGTAPGFGYATVAYNAATGAQLWAARYHGPAPGDDAAHAVAVSPDGRTVYVTGVSKATTTYLVYAYATVAYNAATGAQRWAARYHGPVPSYDTALSVAVSPGGGAVYVTGQSQGTTSGDDYATIAYNATTGAQRWAARYKGPANGDDAATSAAVSPSGKTVYATGYSTGTSGVTGVYATVAYNAMTGAQRWAARYNGPVKGANVAYSLAVSPATGTVYVTGTSGDAYTTVAYHG